jgi:hypothetical protein
MPEIPASEYINSLLTAYQYAEKIYSQAVSDVVAAEIRRDEAKKARDELFVRLENAREKYTSDGTSPNNTSPNDTPPREHVRKNSDGGGRRKLTPQNQSKRKITIRETIEKTMPAEAPRTPTSTEEKVEESPLASTTNISPDILLSPTAGSKKAPRIFLSPGSAGTPRKRASRFVTLMPLVDAKPVLDIAPGRTREWYEKNFDCDSCGLVKKFYLAAFGTKTNEKTQTVTVRTVVLNDEWNELATDTSQIQEMYIGKSKEKDGKPNPRDKAAEALVSPPQKEPIAIFFAPKKSQDTSLVFYGGHWKVIDGEMLNPPRAVKGQTRQWLVKFAFVGVDRLILEALKEAPP